MNLHPLSTLTSRITTAVAWQRQYHKTFAELACHSDRELGTDLRLSRSDIPGLAAKAAGQRVAELLRSTPRRTDARAANARPDPGPTAPAPSRCGQAARPWLMPASRARSDEADNGAGAISRHLA